MSWFKDFDKTFDGVWWMHFKRSQQDFIFINIKLCGVWMMKKFASIVKYWVSQQLYKLKVVFTFLSFYTRKFPRPQYAQTTWTEQIICRIFNYFFFVVNRQVINLQSFATKFSLVWYISFANCIYPVHNIQKHILIIPIIISS